MSDSRENNLKKQKDDSIKFLKQVAEQNSVSASDELLEKIYSAAMNTKPDSKLNLNKEIEKLIVDEVEEDENK